jgi:hypothetical protein
MLAIYPTYPYEDTDIMEIRPNRFVTVSEYESILLIERLIRRVTLQGKEGYPPWDTLNAG